MYVIKNFIGAYYNPFTAKFQYYDRICLMPYDVCVRIATGMRDVTIESYQR